MTTYAMTGATGLVGSNLVLEILKANINALDSTRILVVGRGGSSGIHHRVAAQIRKTGWQYLMPRYDDELVQRACAVLEPIEFDITGESAVLGAAATELMSNTTIDQFYHVAALTDLRHQSHVEERLRKTNVTGTRNVLKLVTATPGRVKQFAFVSSAYVCGKTVGRIAPDYTNAEQEFRNPYERTKLESEVLARRSCREHGIACKIFRPSTIGGRLMEPPIGHVTKCDVYLGWLYFFLRLKSKMLNTTAWEQICTTPVNIPIRIHGNVNVGLNIVAADVCAKAMYRIMEQDGESRSYHLVSERDMGVEAVLTHMLNAANVTGWSIVSKRPDSALTSHERIYYGSVGDIYTPYIIHDRNMEFDCRQTLAAWNGSGAPMVSVDSIATFGKLVQYGIDKKFDMVS
jgi:nucleoside-diphosphate-sugar epimerase